MNEIKALEDYKIEVSNTIEKDHMQYEDQLRRIEDSIMDCNVKMDYEKQRQSILRNQLGDNSRNVNE